MYVIVPVKSLALAKSRLSELLTPRERGALALAMLEDVLTALRATAGIDRIGVVSRDPAALRIARIQRVESLSDWAHDLNSALALAAAQYTRESAGRLLILHADLPLITPAEIGELITALDTGVDLVIAPARDGGTNALAGPAPLPIAPGFGKASLSRHLAAVHDRGLAARLVRTRGLERDIDRPEDLIWLLEQPGETAAQRLVRRMGIIERVACV